MRTTSALGIVFVATVLAFSPLLGGDFEFLSWDDTTNIVNQPIVNTCSIEHLLAAWTTVELGVYEPLGVMLKIVTVGLFGMRVQPFQLTTLALHVMNAWLIFLLARHLLARCDDGLRARLRPDVAALVAALLFALNPMRVEVVAWASGQSYALAGTFFLLSIFAYLRYCALLGEGGEGRRPAGLLALSVVAYLCAVLSKSAAIFLPAVLPLLDYFPLRRRLGLRLVVEKLPHLLTAAVIGGFVVYKTAGLQGGQSFDLDVAARIAYALHSFLFHLGKTLWPAELYPSYAVSHPEVTLVTGWLLFYSVGAAAVCGLAWWSRRRAAWFAAAWGIYLVGMLPVSGLFAHGTWFLGADRYTYLPLFGLWIAGGAIATSKWLVPSPAISDARSRAAICGLVLLLAIWGISTNRQVRHWRNTEALWTHTLARDPANRTALNNLGFYLMEQDRYLDALPLLGSAIALDRGNVKPVLNLGVSLERLGRPEEALHVYRRALQYHPRSPAIQNNMGVAYRMLGQDEKAAEHAKRAEELGFRR
jgi:Tfp pilus assembly protein PilF